VKCSQGNPTEIRLNTRQGRYYDHKIRLRNGIKSISLSCIHTELMGGCNIVSVTIICYMIKFHPNSLICYGDWAV